MPNTQGRDTQERMIYGSLGRDESPSAEDLAAMHDRYWLDIAEDMHRTSTDFLDTNYRKQWEANLAHFNSEHTKDSRFNTANYKSRNKLFRPKTRAISIKSDAALVRALFATEDLISVKPENDADLLQKISAEINQELLQFRLTKTIPWYQTVIGAWQDTFNFGICISYQYWEFETRTRQVPTGSVDENGDESFLEELEIISNKPCVDLIAPENFRFDSNADWRDAINTSARLERIVPMTVQDVEARMEMPAPRGWRKYTRAQIIAASRGFDSNESTRQAREGRGRQDPLTERQTTDSVSTIFCREYFVREGGVDWVYWTIGHHLLLSDPVPIEKAYFHGRRPFVMGYSLLEAHKAIPQSKNQLIAPIQITFNRLANQRQDNVDLVLNKRYFLRRGQNIDTAALIRNVPGGGVYMDDPEKDVKVVTTPDITSSAYEEHNRLAVEMDEIAGNFSTASVQTNRQLNETVGGMQLNRASSDEITEYSIVTFVKTWIEPVLRQLVLLEQAYEDDQVILQLAAGRSDAYRKTNLQGDIPLQLLMQELQVNVNVGIGNTDPTTRVETFAKGLGTVLQVMPQMAARLDEEQVVKEVMGGLGRADGARFFKPADQVQQQVDPRVAQAQADLEFKKYQEDQRSMLRMVEIQHEDDRHYAQLALTRDMTLEKLYAELGRTREANAFKKAELILRAQAERSKTRELTFKASTGRDGI